MPLVLLLLNLVFAGGVAYPWLADLGPILSGMTLALVAWRVAQRRGAAPALAPLLRPFATGWPLRGALVVTSLVVLIGGLEYATQIAIRLGWVAPYGAMETLVPAGTADFRLAHIVADRRREPDPLLWWRPTAAPPYNAQRMKGPIAAIPKPRGTFRILCFGDSNTDGSASASWPELLHALLAPRGPAEVLNAGVAGYSSHQGLLRFLEEADRFRPDLILVSFGWNDATPATRGPDHLFVPPHPAIVVGTRVLIRFDFFRLLLQLAKWRSARQFPLPAAEARVPLARYRSNLMRFASEARARGIEVVFLTRPFREPDPPGAWPAAWIAQVPRYNEALIEFGAAGDAAVIDVHGRLASGHPERFADVSHWNAAGREALAQLLHEEIPIPKVPRPTTTVAPPEGPD